MRKINYKSDFEIDLETGFDPAREEWSAVFYTQSRERGYTCGRAADGTLTSCKAEGGVARCIIDGHGLAPGTLKCELAVNYPDSDYPDGGRLAVTPVELGVCLTAGKGDGCQAIAAGAAEIDIKALAAELRKGLDGKQPALKAGDNIRIDGAVISARPETVTVNAEMGDGEGTFRDFIDSLSFDIIDFDVPVDLDGDSVYGAYDAGKRVCWRFVFPDTDIEIYANGRNVYGALTGRALVDGGTEIAVSQSRGKEKSITLSVNVNTKGLGLVEQHFFAGDNHFSLSDDSLTAITPYPPLIDDLNASCSVDLDFGQPNSVMADYRILVNCKWRAIDKIKFDDYIDWEHPLPDALEKGYWYLITIHSGNDDSYIGRIVLGEWKRFGQPQEGARP